MSAPTLLIVYCSLILLASLAGGWLPLLFRLTHVWLQVAMSFVGGAMLGVGLLHLLPHAYFAIGEIYPPVVWLLVGFLCMFFVERVFHFHHHDPPPEDLDGPPQESIAVHDHSQHSHAHAHHEHDGHAGQSRRLSWGAALMGLALHSTLDGLALAASVLAETSPGGHVEPWAGLVVFLVIALHKPFDSLTLGTLMAVDGRSARARHLVNFLYALAVPLGALVFGLGAQAWIASEQRIVGSALAFAAGTFICIATSDLLPELQFHSHDRWKLSIALLLGISMAGVMVAIEASGHRHEEKGTGDRAVIPEIWPIVAFQTPPTRACRLGNWPKCLGTWPPAEPAQMRQASNTPACLAVHPRRPRSRGMRA